MENIRAKTQRYKKDDGKFEFVNYSPNLGLESYLAASSMRSSISVNQKHVKETIKRLYEQSRIQNGYRVWGWEYTPSVPGVYFPPDWDDTSKALDVLYQYSKSYNLGRDINQKPQIPDSGFIESLFEKSVIYEDTLGTNCSIPCDYSPALSVFFGPSSEEKSPRDDPMVTVAALTTIVRWYPEVFREKRDIIQGMLKRILSAVKVAITGDISFRHVSRYYFSGGHFMYRLIELFDCMGDDESLPINLSKYTSCRAEDILNNTNDLSSKTVSYDDIWWLLSGLAIGQVRPVQDVREAISGTEDKICSFVYRHRRLNHYYKATDWNSRIQRFELSRLLQRYGK